MLQSIQTLDPKLALQKWQPAGRIGDFGIFLTV